MIVLEEVQRSRAQMWEYYYWTVSFAIDKSGFYPQTARGRKLVNSKVI